MMLARDTCAPVRHTLYSLNFLITLVTALITYFTTPLLVARGVPDSAIGYVFIGSAIANLVLLFLAPNIFTRFGNYRTLIWLSGIAVGALAMLAYVPDTGAVIALFILYTSVTTLAFLLLDMVLEGSMPSEGITGGTRGFFMTMSEVAWFLGPVLAGWIIGVGSFELLFLIAAALSVPAISITMKRLGDIRRHVYIRPDMRAAVGRIMHDTDLRGAFATQLLLRMFYSMMVIYVPLYLVEHVGVSYGSFGAILSLAMIAYLFLDYPIGMLADRKLGEKEIMVAGFTIIAITTALLSLGFGTGILLWGAILFGTRIGASFLDVSTESYFFKHMTGENADLVSMYRMLGPIAYLLAPVLGSILLLFVPLQALFLCFGAFFLVGIPFALSIHDTR